MKPSPDVLLTELPDGQGVLLHLGTKFYYTLNATGLEVWRALAAEQETDAAALAARVVERFDVELDVARRDVESLLAELRAARLIAG